MYKRNDTDKRCAAAAPCRFVFMTIAFAVAYPCGFGGFRVIRVLAVSMLPPARSDPLQLRGSVGEFVHDWRGEPDLAQSLAHARVQAHCAVSPGGKASPHGFGE